VSPWLVVQETPESQGGAGAGSIGSLDSDPIEESDPIEID